MRLETKERSGALGLGKHEKKTCPKKEMFYTPQKEQSYIGLIDEVLNIIRQMESSGEKAQLVIATLEKLKSEMKARRKNCDYFNDWSDAIKEYLVEDGGEIAEDIKGDTILYSMDMWGISSFLDWLFEEVYG